MSSDNAFVDNQPGRSLGLWETWSRCSLYSVPRAALAVGSSHQPSSSKPWSMNASGRRRPIYLLVSINISEMECNQDKQHRRLREVMFSADSGTLLPTRPGPAVEECLRAQQSAAFKAPKVILMCWGGLEGGGESDFIKRGTAYLIKRDRAN